MGAIMSGMDFNPHFVAAARNKFYRADLPGTFTNDDMRHAVFPHNQDLVINWASSFGISAMKATRICSSALPKASSPGVNF